MSKTNIETKPIFTSTSQASSWDVIAGDCLDVMGELACRKDAPRFDMIFADPPYFLSNGGTTCRSGKQALVDKGAWDASRGHTEDHEFNKRWLSLCGDLLSKDGTIWVSGTHHVIYSVGHALQEVGFKILNDIVWEKPNPPPNLGCRNFTHSTEIILWAAKSRKSRHFFDYHTMKAENGGKQMKNVWRLSAPTQSEKSFGRHPTQKPLTLMNRIVSASTRPGCWVLDPFAGSGTTGVACVLAGRNFIGIERDTDYAELARKRISGACV